MTFLFLTILLAAPPAHYLEQWKAVRKDDCGELLFLSGRLKKFQHKFTAQEQETILSCEKRVFPVKGLGEVGPNHVFLVPAREQIAEHPERPLARIPAGIWYVGFVPFLADFARRQFQALPEAEAGDSPDFGFGRYVKKPAFLIETREHGDLGSRGNGGGRKLAGPRVQVTFDEARELCKKAGGDLPDEEQWEIAARGASYYRPFPFGESIPMPCFGKTGPQCAKDKTPLDISPWGVWSLGSGVAEWVLPAPSRLVPTAMSVTKGGTTGDHFYWNIVPARRLVPSQTRSDAIGFRCVFPEKHPAVR